MKEYELTVLIHPDLESDLEAPLGTVRELVKSAGGTITKEDVWGKQKLAYAINKQHFAVYVYMECELPADAPLKISGALNISDSIIRYLLVKVDHKSREALEAAKAKAASRQSDDSSEER